MLVIAQSLLKELGDLIRYRWLIYMSVLTTLKMRYRRSALGFFWSLLGPALNYGTLAAVFYFGLKTNVPNYLMYVFPGILCFSFFASTLNHGSMALIANEMFLKKIYLPKSIFVVNSAVSELSNFCLNTVTMLLLTFFWGKFSPSSLLLYLPIFILMYFFFALGLALLTALATVFFRDLQHVVPISMQALFYTTPVLFVPESFPEKLQFIFQFNPLFNFIQLFRGVFYDPQLLNTKAIFICLGYSAISFFLGLIFLKLNDNKIVFRL
ncbi:MAG: ABC transporter permease [Bdellovibrio sp.]